jgi:hypothetical protein
MFLLFLAASALAQQDEGSVRNHPKVLAARDMARSGSEERLYDSGTRALDANRWDDAVKAFSETASRKGTHADGALYWKAYAENRMGQRDTSLTTIAALKRDYPSSRWLNDAQALEVEVNQQSGKPVSPDSESNEDLKILALNGLLQSDPDQALPIVEKLLKSNSSPKLKDRALFVLSQSRSPKARDILTGVAKGGSNPDLQSKAIRYIAISGNKDARQQLLSIYSPSNDINVKKQIVRSLGIMPAAESGDSLVSIYSSEQDLSIKRDACNALFVQNNAKALVALARKESNMALKQDLVQKLSVMHSKDATAYLMEVLQE